METIEFIRMKHLTQAFCILFLMLAMIPAVLAQETVSHESTYPLKEKGFITNSNIADKGPVIYGFVTDRDASIYGLTLGRGFGGNVTNAVFGRQALDDNTTGSWNSAFGEYAMGENTSGTGNTALGAQALRNNSTGMYNDACGYLALFSNTTGYSNIAMGVGALYNNIDRVNLVAIGDSALYSNGINASQAWEALFNTAVGSKTLYFNTTGSWNTATGYRALVNNTSGSNNTAVGSEALFYNSIDQHNTAIGALALGSLGFGQPGGSFNTAVGSQSFQTMGTGSDNTAVGHSAGSIFGMSQGTFLGSNAFPIFSAGSLTNVTGIGYNVRPTASNQVRIGDANVNSIGGYANWTNISDGGYKSDIAEDVAGLDFILKLRPVSYHLDVHKLAADLGEDMTFDRDGNKTMSVPDEITLKSRNDKAAIRYTGFIAQEVEATVNELGVAFGGVDAPANKSGHYGLRYAEFVVPLVKAVQEQQARIELLELKEVRAENAGMQKELQEVKAENADIMIDLFNVKESNKQLEEKNTELEVKVDQILALLKQQGIDLGSSLTNDPSRSGSDRSDRDMGASTVRLEQNAPNPFQENTVIRYYLHENSGKAQLIVTDLQGNRIQTSELTVKGSGQLTIDGGSLTAGTYVYSLIIDGQVADSKRMVLL